jgi:hypothetical protein
MSVGRGSELFCRIQTPADRGGQLEPWRVARLRAKEVGILRSRAGLNEAFSPCITDSSPCPGNHLPPTGNHQAKPGLVLEISRRSDLVVVVFA